MNTCVTGKFQLQLIAYFENILNSMKVLNVLTVIYLHTQRGSTLLHTATVE